MHYCRRVDRLANAVSVSYCVLQCAVVNCSELRRAIICCNIHICCNILHCVFAVRYCQRVDHLAIAVSVCCSALRCVAVCCSMLQCIAACRCVLQYVFLVHHCRGVDHFATLVAAYYNVLQ